MMTTRAARTAHSAGPEPLAFDLVVREHGTAVLRVCRSLLADPADADDAWSDTFLAALTVWPRVPDGVAVQAWLVGIARHKAIDIIRARARTTPVGEPTDAEAASGLDPVDTIVLSAALATLSERQRRAVVLHHLAGIPWPDVAMALDSTPTAVRRAGSDGIAALRRLLKETQ